MADDESLVARITQRARMDNPNLPAPISAEVLKRAESVIGFQLHPLLATIYLRVANGRFGPETGILPLVSENNPTGETAVGQYLRNRSVPVDSAWAWPEGVLPILHWGCAVYTCVDCRSESGTVLLFEPNPGDPDRTWFVESSGIATWLDDYIDNSGWWCAETTSEAFQRLRPWTHSKVRAREARASP